MKKSIIIFIVIISQIYSVWGQCINCDSSNTVAGSSVIGQFNDLQGSGSVVIGSSSQTGVLASNSIAIGSRVKTLAGKSIVIGSGINTEYMLTNHMQESLLIGFNSNLPTFFVSKSSGFGLTGKIGIGNITDQNGQIIPQAKLHIRADEGEDAVLLLEPNNWESGESATIQLGNPFHNITSDKTHGIKFNSENNFIFNGEYSGFGVDEPKAKVHINGDLLFDQSLNGIIMKSEDGNCWKGTISNIGELEFSMIDCETLSSNNNLAEQKRTVVFIYPNPSNGLIAIDYKGKEKQVIVEVNTISGLLINTYKIRQGETEINISDISEQIIILTTYSTKGDLISTNKILIRK